MSLFLVSGLNKNCNFWRNKFTTIDMYSLMFGINALDLADWILRYFITPVYNFQWGSKHFCTLYSSFNLIDGSHDGKTMANKRTYTRTKLLCRKVRSKRKAIYFWHFIHLVNTSHIKVIFPLTNFKYGKCFHAKLGLFWSNTIMFLQSNRRRNNLLNPFEKLGSSRNFLQQKHALKIWFAC